MPDRTETSPGDGAPVVVSREVPLSRAEVWKLLLGTEGTQALLGPGASLGEKGHAWQATDGTHGVTRSVHPLEQIRVSWHRDGDAPATVVDVHLRAAGENSTQLEVVHDHLDPDADRAWLEVHWTEAFERISSLV